jgi:hypothetical protein
MILLLVAQSGCGRKYTIIGRVIVAPDETSRIIEISPGPVPAIGTPVSGAHVEICHELDKDGHPVPGTVWVASDTSAADGSVELYGYWAPGKQSTVGIEASAPGYTTVYRTYVDYYDPDQQYFLILLTHQQPLGRR